MTYLEFRKEMIDHDIKSYRWMMKYNMIAILILNASVATTIWLIYLNIASTTLHVLAGSQIATVIFLYNLYSQTKIDYKNSLYHRSLLDSHEDFEKVKLK
jgi:hypothetical protein